ncbi:Z1 domain-containing protein [Streptomyces sp. PU10]|uniref:Z1 domain-containing protein n=1 Tax=Streptomyces TaxID=1883 RepID=UPI0015907F22|nr:MULTISPECIES: Z1 domain-containing protein [unclassified Streptomyces]MDU0256249.1 Z1 domain-containing protein [Streptomyces sp. PU10]QKW61110.1 Z1 domain-containing protein [Streptomyces sp. NA03103]WSU01305.1 Z1 domain-containing protein [Streptomyces sp. NBC_01124]
MTSVGNRIEQHLFVLKAIMDRDGLTLEESLTRYPGLVPLEDHDAVRQHWEKQQRTTTIIRTVRPTEVSATGGPRPWFQNWDTADGYYWTRQHRFLSHVLHRQTYEIDSLDRASDRVLSHLEDPRHPEPFSVRGLVVGHVQSGKTSNFSALIAKASDAGYKIIIVLSGLHNTLRLQTQRRLQRDLGHENVPFPNGVGQGDPDKYWTWLTHDHLDGDFDPGVNVGPLQGQNQVILVVKKNKTRLDRLLEWLENKVPEHVPVLVIDDEADQASVNTGGNRADDEPVSEVLDLRSSDYDGDVPSDDELNPSAINLRIRRLLRCFARVSYVAYTATPFANILINPNAEDRVGGDDLFPRDFIITLPHPPGQQYVGPDRLFGREQLPGEVGQVEGLDVIRIVPNLDVKQIVPPKGKGKPYVPKLPNSLKIALTDFLLAAAGRMERNSGDQPCTMLVHVDMRKESQDNLASEISAELGHMRQQWRYDRGEYLPILRDRWDTEFRPLTSSVDLDKDTPFEKLEQHLDTLFGPGIEVRILNSNHEDELDFEAEPDLKAVLVGGNKLSRGVTVEGLLVSYFVRSTPYYDTLLQMGRWFGYRGDYVDLTRLYSTQTLITWFHDLATIEEELRRQIEHYARRRLTPWQSAPRIRSHEKMLPTAKNKMKETSLQQDSFDGRKLQTLRFPFDDPAILDVCGENLRIARTLLRSLGRPHEADSGRLSWKGVNAEAIVQFIEGFQFSEQSAFDVPAVVSYIQAQTQHNELTYWRVLVSSASNRKKDHATVDLGISDHPEVAMIRRSRLIKDPTSLGVVTEPEDELLGLSPDEIEEAHRLHKTGEFTMLGDAFRSQRSPREGLLVLYPIDPGSGPGAYAKNRRRLFEEGAERPDCVLTYAISFPYSNSPSSVSYVVGRKAGHQ